MINVTGEIIVRTTKGGGHFTNTATSNEEGSKYKYDYAPILVGFRKGVTIQDNTRIKITNGFLTHFRMESENDDKPFRNKIMILDFEIVNNEKTSNDDMPEFPSALDDELPF